MPSAAINSSIPMELLVSSSSTDYSLATGHWHFPFPPIATSPSSTLSRASSTVFGIWYLGGVFFFLARIVSDEIIRSRFSVIKRGRQGASSSTIMLNIDEDFSGTTDAQASQATRYT